MVKKEGITIRNKLEGNSGQKMEWGPIGDQHQQSESYPELRSTFLLERELLGS